MFENRNFVILIVFSLVLINVYQYSIILEKNTICTVNQVLKLYDENLQKATTPPLDLESKKELIASTENFIDYKNLQTKWIKEFAEIGNKHGTDKISVHNYQTIYGKYLGKY
jgi:hypothetical protein